MCDDEIEIDNHEFKESSFPFVNEIEEHHADKLTYNDFFEQFMIRNVPVLISGIAEQWECMNWVLDSQANTENCNVNFEYLKHKIDSKQIVPIANCSKVYFNSHEKTEITFDEFIHYWQCQVQQIEHDSSELLYLKDWHLRRNQSYQFYKTPIYFASDWLNEYCEEKNSDDYRFVYMGPKGTWTPFHADVFSSFSWSTNICGRKKWTLFPPNEENKLRDSLGNLPFDIGEENHMNRIRETPIRSFEVLQHAGQTLFVPSGWHHQVWNLEDTISVNHNWFNGCNIHRIWAAIHAKFKDVLREIDDCKDMDGFDEHCQLMLKSDFGLDFQMFLDILSCIINNRIQILESNNRMILNECMLGRRHAIFDLHAIRRVLNDFVVECSLDKLQQSSQSMISQIDDVITHLYTFSSQ